jgi:hypothetical protein
MIYIYYTSPIQYFCSHAEWPCGRLLSCFFPSGGRGRIVARRLRHALDGVWRVVFFGPDTCETRQGTALWVMVMAFWIPHGCEAYWLDGGYNLWHFVIFVYWNHTSLLWETLFKGIEIGRKKEHRELKKRVQLPMLASTAPSYLPASCQFTHPKGHLFHYLPSDSRVNCINILVTPIGFWKNKASNLVTTISISAPPKPSWASQGSAPYVAKFVRNWANEDLWYICKLDGLWWLYTYS